LSKLSYPKAITSSQDLIQVVEKLKELTNKYPASIITVHNENVIVAINAKVSTTKYSVKVDELELNLATQSAVWWLQNKTRSFEALTTAAYSLLDLK
jgi:hypothetical protein